MENSEEEKTGFWKTNGRHFLNIGVVSMILTVAVFLGLKLLFIYFFPGMEGSFLEMLLISILVARVIVFVYETGFKMGLNRNRWANND